MYFFILSYQPFNPPTDIFCIICSEKIAKTINMGIIESNNTETFVIWTDSGESIIGIPNGQLGIDKLAEFLSFQTDESLSVIQRIGSVIDRKNGKLLPSEELLSAQAEYKLKFGKDVAPVMKNNLVWIQKELAK